jgi:hypothetical protein
MVSVQPLQLSLKALIRAAVLLFRQVKCFERVIGQWLAFYHRHETSYLLHCLASKTYCLFSNRSHSCKTSSATFVYDTPIRILVRGAQCPLVTDKYNARRPCPKGLSRVFILFIGTSLLKDSIHLYTDCRTCRTPCNRYTCPSNCA